MKSIFFTVFIFLMSIVVAKSQVILGFHTGISGYTGIHTDISIEVPIHHRFFLNSRASYVLGQGLMIRTGIRYVYPVMNSLELRIGFDLGVYDQRNIFTTFFADLNFVSGGNFGLHHKLNEKWGILGELNLLEFKNFNSKNQSFLLQLGVTFSFNQ